MTIEKLSECKSASKYGTCSECGISESEAHNLYRLKFNGVSVCLCPDCFSKARQIINRRYIDVLSYKAENEIQCNCTDEEIHTSFIEDVEAIKDLLSQTQKGVTNEDLIKTILSFDLQGRK